MAPTVSTMGASSNGTYNPSQNIDFTVNFNENVTVTGTPRLTLTVGSSTRYATYQSGSGGTALVFRYSPSVGDLDTNGIAFSNTNIDLNSGTLRDALSNNATLSFSGSAPSLTGINVDGVVPTVSITSPSVINSANASSYAVGGACSENGRQVSVSVGGVSATPNCSSSAWTATVNVSGVSDGAIDMTADHSDAAGNNATSATASVNKDATGPTVSTMGASGNGTYNPSQNIDFTVNFNENVTVAGTPRLTLTVGSSTRYATYQSGSGGTALVFRYSPSVGDLDTNGIAFSNTNIDLNSGTLRDALSNNATLSFLGSAPSLTGINVDGVVPTVSITSPSVINSANASSYAVGGACSENGRQVSVSVGGVSATPNCSSSAWTATVNVSGVSDGTTDMTADHNDAALNNANSATASVSKDTMAPTVSTMGASSNGTYNPSQNIDFTVNFNENVTVAGTPRLTLTVGSSTRYATYQSGSGGTALVFRYSPSVGDLDTNGIAFSNTNIDLNSGTLRDALSNNATLSFSGSAPSLTGINVDGVVPTVSITSPSVINSANASSYSLSGTCSENGRQVSVSVGGVSATPNCSSSAWTATVNVSGVSDGAIDMTADHSDAAGNNATSATASASKDTVIPTVSITSSPVINDSNASSYSLSGTCSENGRQVSVSVGGVSATPNCSSSAWTATVNVSGVSDGTTDMTADHSDAAGNNATSATASVTKDATAPTLTGTPDASADDATDSQARTISWPSSPSDAGSGLNKIEIAVGTTSGGSDVVSWREIPSGLTLSPRTYQIVNGLDGFSVSLSSGTNYYTSLRAVDNAGNNSSSITSSAWQRLFVPSDISSLQLWFDASDLGTLYQDNSCATAVTANSDPIGCWQDKGGNSNHALQPTANQRPTYDSTGRAVNLDGSNDWFDLQSNTGLPYGSSSRTALAVTRLDNISGTWRWIFAYGTPSTGQSYFLGRNGSTCATGGYGSSPDLSVSSCWVASQWLQMASGYDGTTASLWKDGNLETSAAKTWNTVDSVTRLGRQTNNAAEYWNGDIRELVIFDDDLSTNDRQMVEGYLACKWGIQSRLPAGHPYESTCP